MKNDKNCSTNHVGRFSGQNQLILSWFESLRSFGKTKCDKVLTEIFLVVLMENDKNCFTNHLKGFWGKTNPLYIGLKVWEVFVRLKVTKFKPKYF